MNRPLILVLQLIAFAATLVLASGPARSAGIGTGLELLKYCTEAQDSLKIKSDTEEAYPDELMRLKHAGECVHFLRGFDSGQAVVSKVNEVPGVHCSPKSSNTGDMVNAVVGYLEQNERFHNMPAGIAAWQALANHWPCD